MARRGRSRRFILTPAAAEDLTEISDYLLQESPGAGRRVREALRQAMRGLATMPGKGHVREDLAPPSLRFWSVYSYLIVYRADTDPIQIVRVLHGARDLREILEDEREP